MAGFHFRRTERIVIEWPVFDDVQTSEVRVLGRDGQPLALPAHAVARTSGDLPVLASDFNLAPLSAGEYLIVATRVATAVRHVGR